MFRVISILQLAFNERVIVVDAMTHQAACSALVATLFSERINLIGKRIVSTFTLTSQIGFGASQDLPRLKEYTQNHDIDLNTARCRDLQHLIRDQARADPALHPEHFFSLNQPPGLNSVCKRKSVISPLVASPPSHAHVS